MKQNPAASVQPLVARIHCLFSNDLALEKDFLRAGKRVLRDLPGDERPTLT
jgi:hypothetical protein